MLGLTPHPAETADGATIVSLPFGDSEVELLHPQTPDSPVGKFLAKRGPGLHHVAYQVTDIDAALASLKDAGVRLLALTHLSTRYFPRDVREHDRPARLRRDLGAVPRAR